MRRALWVAVAVGLGLSWSAGALAREGAANFRELVKGAIVDYPAVVPLPVDKLRAAGPAALDELFKIRDEIAADFQKEMAKNPTTIAETAAVEHQRRQLERLDKIIDQVGQQKYCSRSRLYWYTSFDEAQAAAQKSGKPILSLRMLGNLDEEFSCANSRFFRTTLYANEAISQALRDNYILHWKSVRPVPKVTIDFGDGRKLERTLTGNSIHYILTPDGTVVEALPGLYGPQVFLEKINAGASLARQMAALSPSDRNAAISAYHQRSLREVTERFQADMARASLIVPPRSATSNGSLVPSASVAAPLARSASEGNEAATADGAQPSQTPLIEASLAPYRAAPAQATAEAAPPRADRAAELARPKGMLELPLVAAALPLATTPDELQDEATWQAIAALHAEEARVDDASRELIRSENPTAAVAGRLAITKRRVEDPLVRLVRSLESSIALDSVRNEYQLHRTIHGWLADASYKPDVETLNERVYAEVFLTPRSDPWLGLAPADVYTALSNGGVVGK